MSWQLAQLNIARMKYDPDGSEMDDFNQALDPVNASAEASEGFVWRLQSGEEESEDEQVFGDPGWLVNLSVWEDLDSLLSFVRSERHLSIMQRRREWFAAVEEATLVLWWIPADRIPTVAEAQERLEALRRQGHSPFAFGFNHVYPRPGEEQ